MMLVLPGCSGGLAAASTTVTASVPPTSPAVTEPASSTTPPTTTTIIATTTTVPATTLHLPAFPPERPNLEHGGDAWVVVLAASEEFEDPILAEAVGHARDAGYLTGATDCDVGAAAAVGLSESDRHYYTVSVYLNSETDAEVALEAFLARGVDGAVARVQTYCLD
jgi:hypothetical protein